MINNRRLQQLISLVLIFPLLFSGGFKVVLASDPAPTSAPVPTSAPAPTSAPLPKSTPKERSQPRDPEPTAEPTSPHPTIPASEASSSPASVSPSPTTQPPGSTPTPAVSDDSDALGSPTPTIQARYSTGTLGFSTGSTGTASSTANLPASADDPKNVNTGPYSENSGSLTDTSATDINNKNNAEVSNSIGVESETGVNFANFNSLAGNVFTGDALANLSLLNKLNAAFTGSGGFVTFDIYDQHMGDVVFDWIETVSDTFGVGNPLESVDAATEAVVENSTTGPFSENEGEQANTNEATIETDNDAKVEQDITVVANTGENSASYNTGGGSIKTGDATAFANIVNLVNTSFIVENWLIGIVNIFGSLLGDIILPPGDYSTSSQDSGLGGTLVTNDTTGPFSQNQATATDSAATTLESTSSAKVVNNITVEANTGDNDASLNTKGGKISTGESSVNVNENTVANTNSYGDTVWVVIVNELGHWVGYIFGAPWGATTASSDNLPVLDGNPADNTYVGNEVSGSFSENEAELTQVSEADIANQNDAELVNNITVKANTGENAAMANTGTGSIQTGNADAGLNLFNMVNTNVVATKFVAVLVNVFGEFLGSIVPPIDETANHSSNVDGDTPSFIGGPLADNVSNSSSAETEGGSDDSASILGNYDSFDPSGSSSSEKDNQQDLTNGDSVSTDVPPTLTGQSGDGGQSDTSLGGISDAGFSSDYRYSSQSQLPGMEMSKTFRSRKTQRIGYWYGVSPLFKAYTTPLSAKYSRGPFVSSTLAKASEGNEGGLLFFGSKYQVTSSWLVIVPIAVFILLLRRRYVLIPIKKYVFMLMEVIL